MGYFLVHNNGRRSLLWGYVSSDSGTASKASRLDNFTASHFSTALEIAPRLAGNNGCYQELIGRPTGARKMLNVVVTLLIIALIAGVLGFGGIAGAAVGIAKIVFVVALILFLVSLLAGGMRGSFSRRL